LLHLLYFTALASLCFYTLSLHDALPILLEVLPALLELGGVFGIDHEVDREQLVGVQSLAVAQRLDLSEVDRVYEDEHPQPRILRSEEHTSELQSPYDLVCRLLLEKKKQT